MDAPRHTTTDTYHGVQVSEEYRWLEERSDESDAWTAEQNQATRAYLDAIPAWPAIARRVGEILRSESTSYVELCPAGIGSGSPSYVALKRQPPKQQPFLVLLTDLDSSDAQRVLLDPNELDPSGATTIDFFEPSPDGSRIAVSLSQNGTEQGIVHVRDIATGEEVGDPLPFVNSGGFGGVAWRGDGSGFWCTHYPEPEEAGGVDAGFYQDIAYHDLATGRTTVELTGVFADDKIAQHVVTSSADGRWVLDRVQKGDGGEWQTFIRPQQGGAWQQVADIDRRWVDAQIGPDDVLYALSTADAPLGQILRIELPDGRPGVIVPHSDRAIEGFVVTQDALWVADIVGGPSSVRRFTLDGAGLPDVDLPPTSAVQGLTRYGRGIFSDMVDLGEGRVAFTVESYTSPPEWWVGDSRDTGRPAGLESTSPIDLSAYQTTRVLATSKDGTQVPINLIQAPGTPPGAPVLLTAYGGYGLSLRPRFSPLDLLWLEQGGIHAVANIRGGGEFGEPWHAAGRLTTKQNCFDDFIACADHLVETAVTTREQLAILGGSNGGLLMGAVLTQRPDLAAAVVCMVPVLDAIRSETTRNGEFNTTEFGTVDDEAEFRALLAYSPYHHVVDGTDYPAVLLTAGEYDQRVEAWHAKKMTARLQAASSGSQPILLRTEAGGHGIGASLDQRVSESTDRYAFVVDRLGLTYAG